MPPTAMTPRRIEARYHMCRIIKRRRHVERLSYRFLMHSVKLLGKSGDKMVYFCDYY